MSKAVVGGHVTYTDEHQRTHHALITSVHGEAESKPAVNLVFVNMTEGQSDSYGQKMERRSSCVHAERQSAQGNFWSF